MKALAILALLLAGAASADTVQFPNLLAPYSCGSMQIAYDNGRLWEHTSCSTGGRGTRPRQLTACAELGADGWETLWKTNEIGLQYPHQEQCL